MLSTGSSLDDLPMELMLDVGYFMMITAASTRTEDVVKAREAFKRQLRNAEFEATTGMPAITQMIPPADARDFSDDE